jgi:streptogramin lyase
LGLVFALSSLVASCAQQPPAFAPAAAEERVERITQIPLPGSGYIYDVAVADGAVWVTSQAGLLRVDPVTSEMLRPLGPDGRVRGSVASARHLMLGPGSNRRCCAPRP